MLPCPWLLGQSTFWSSALRIRVAIVLVLWVVRHRLFLWHGGGMGGGGARRGVGARQAGFAAAPRVLNCSGIHGDKLLSCLSSARKPSM